MFLYLSLFFQHKAFLHTFFGHTYLTYHVLSQCQSFDLTIFTCLKSFFLSFFLLKYSQSFRSLSDHICSIKSSVEHLLYCSSCIFIILLQLYLAFFLIYVCMFYPWIIIFWKTGPLFFYVSLSAQNIA